MGVFRPIDRFVETQDGDVVIEGTGVEFRVNINGNHVAFYVRVEFHVVVDIPFA